MKKDNIFSIVAMGCGLLLIISVFLPYVTYYSSSLSLWKMEDSSRFIYIILGLLVIAVYLINKKTELSYLTVGYGLFTTVSQIISLEGFEGLSIGFYLILLSSLTIGVMTFLYEEKEADALINLSVSINKPVVNTAQPVINNQPVNQEIISNSTINNMQSEVVSNPIINNVQPEVNPMRFDPMTGEPVNPNNNQLH